MEGQATCPDEAALLRVLREHFGLPGFRPGQLEAVSATLSGRDSVVILPTGGGKSVCFQLPCHVREFGFTVVICPLIALAKDQVDKCDERGIYAERWNCEVPESRKASIAKDIASDEPSLRLLYTTPESLRQPKLLESLKEACANGTLVSFAVDEAHTVSEWGHDFRPAYLELSCIKQEFPSVPVTALTASCTSKVQADIVSVLRLRSPQVIKGSFNRPNIAYQVRHKELIGDGSDASALEDLVKFIQERPDQCGIIYARLRATCDWLASSLAARDVEVGCYHAGKGTDAKARVQRDWSSGGLNVVVATIAFGMGIDRADVRWVVHWNAPSSMEGFYQESGRAGRDGLPSLAVMYASRSDLEANHKMERGTRSGAVAEVSGYAQGAGCRRKHVLKFFGEDRGACDRSADQLCDFCTDPRAVQRALSKLEQRESEQGSKAAVVRARMMGIRVAPDNEEVDGAAGAEDNQQGAKPRATTALWSRATAYGSTAPDKSEDAMSQDAQPPAACASASANAHSSRGVGMGEAGTQGKRTLLPRRPPAIKRALPTSSTAVVPSEQACDAAKTTHGRGASGDLSCPLALPSARSPRAEDSTVVAASMPAGSLLDIAEGEEEAMAPPAVSASLSSHTRQPQLKRIKPSVQLPFKAPARTDPRPAAGNAEGSAVAGLAREQQSRGTHAAQEQALPVVVPLAADSLRCATSTVGLRRPLSDSVGTGQGAQAADAPAKGCTAAPVPLALKRRLPFKPPMRISQV